MANASERTTLVDLLDQDLGPASPTSAALVLSCTLSADSSVLVFSLYGNNSIGEGRRPEAAFCPPSVAEMQMGVNFTTMQLRRQGRLEHFYSPNLQF